MANVSPTRAIDPTGSYHTFKTYIPPICAALAIIAILGALSLLTYQYVTHANLVDAKWIYVALGLSGGVLLTSLVFHCVCLTENKKITPSPRSSPAQVEPPKGSEHERIPATHQNTPSQPLIGQNNLLQIQTDPPKLSKIASSTQQNQNNPLSDPNCVLTHELVTQMACWPNDVSPQDFTAPEFPTSLVVLKSEYNENEKETYLYTLQTGEGLESVQYFRKKTDCEAALLEAQAKYLSDLKVRLAPDLKNSNSYWEVHFGNSNYVFLYYADNQIHELHGTGYLDAVDVLRSKDSDQCYQTKLKNEGRYLITDGRKLVEPLSTPAQSYAESELLKDAIYLAPNECTFWNREQVNVYILLFKKSDEFQFLYFKSIEKRAEYASKNKLKNADVRDALWRDSHAKYLEMASVIYHEVQYQHTTVVLTLQSTDPNVTCLITHNPTAAISNIKYVPTKDFQNIIDATKVTPQSTSILQLSEKELAERPISDCEKEEILKSIYPDMKVPEKKFKLTRDWKGYRIQIERDSPLDKPIITYSRNLGQ